MLIESHRITPTDYALWNEYEQLDAEYAGTSQYREHIESGLSAIFAFVAKGRPHFVGTSWGKDSTVLVHMFLRIRPETRIVYVRQMDNANPHSVDVRDQILARYNPPNYEEIAYSYSDADSSWYKNGRPNHWYKVLDELNRKYGVHVTGIRPDESGKREKRFRVFGMETENSFAPFQYLTHKDIFAYLYCHYLPVHPNYAMLGGGRWERERIRTAAIGNKEGDGMGRAEWEKEYYPDVLAHMKARP